MTSDVYAQLQTLYDSLPTIACKGDCWNSCGPIDMSKAERDRISFLGVEIPAFSSERARRWANDEPLHCPALTADRRCSVYEVRPLICRAWGVAESMPCVHGCKPDHYLSDEEMLLLVARSMQIGGSDTLTASPEEQERMVAMLQDPAIGPLMKRFMRGDRSVETKLVLAIEAWKSR